MPRILYVEDDETLSFITKDHLELKGYEVHHCNDGMQALEEFKGGEFDICVLDVMLPRMDGFVLATEIRKRDRDIPILFLTAKSLKDDRLEGLRLGGDDYITKPFSIEELILRIEVFLKRSKVHSEAPSRQYAIGKYTFDYNNLTLSEGSEVSNLTEREADLLKYLTENANRVIKRSDILLSVWGEDDYFLGRSLDVFISRLRKYLKADDRINIENVHGVGFRFIVPD
ncbi:MAG TPA: response regulator transcription factor [Saprospiraceae bacterium]|nr:response regulator transcription factor [Saprospiraceae bacterium]